MRKFRFFSRRLIVAALIVGVLAGITIGGPVAAAPFTKVTWKVASLQPDQVINLHDVVSTNSPGVKTWSGKGSCTLTPRKNPTELKMGVEGSCVLKLKIARSKSYSAKRTQRTITLTPSTTTTTGDGLTCAAGGRCAVGETGPGGGTVFYVASSQFTSIGSACGTACRYLEVAPVGWVKSLTYSTKTSCVRFGLFKSICNTVGFIESPSFTGEVDCHPSQYGDPYLEDPSCTWLASTASGGSFVPTGTGIGTGHANTSAIITQNAARGSAANFARAFQGGDKTDWFLPSKDELNALCKWAFEDTKFAVCSPSYYMDNKLKHGGFTIKTRGSFSYSSYWSSSEQPEREYPEVGLVWYLIFEKGKFCSDRTNSDAHVRPVRAF